ncbi:ISL3 family transposase, partial [Facklamia miroungae]
FISCATKQKIASLATDTTSEKKIASQTHVSIHTVRRVVDAFACAIRKRPTTLPEHLCFDEFKSTRSVKGVMSFIYCDAVTHQVVDIVEDRRLYALKEHFYRYSRQERKKVKTICIDMYVPYIKLIRQLFPNATIIIDRFHIVQALNRELNRCRIQGMNQVRYKDRRLYNKLKRYWKLFLMKEKKLEYTRYERFPLFDSLTNTGNVVDYLLNQNEVLKNTYRVVQDLRFSLDQSDPLMFLTTLYQASNQSLTPGLKRVLKTFTKFKQYIKNTFHYHTLTNGPIEGINNKIKVLKRNAYGYKNYSHFKNRILLISRLYVSGRKEKETKQLFVA